MTMVVLAGSEHSSNQLYNINTNKREAFIVYKTNRPTLQTKQCWSYAMFGFLSLPNPFLNNSAIFWNVLYSQYKDISWDLTYWNGVICNLYGCFGHGKPFNVFIETFNETWYFF